MKTISTNPEISMPHEGMTSEEAAAAAKKTKLERLFLMGFCIVVGLSLFASAVSAYNFPGMQNLSDLIDDITTIAPKLITLAMIFLVIAVAYKFRDGLGKMLTNIFH